MTSTPAPPPASQPAPAPAPVSATPRRLRLVTALLAALVVTVLTVVAVLLKSSTTGVVVFQTSDQVAMVGLGLVLGAAVLAVGLPWLRAKGIEVAFADPGVAARVAGLAAMAGCQRAMAS